MLTVTDNASAAVRDLTERAGLPRSGGLRITDSTQQTGSFELALVTEPVPDDVVVEANGATIFIAAGSSSALSGLRLDAEPTTADGPGFSLVAQD